MKIKVTKNSLEKFDYFSACGDSLRLDPVPQSQDGMSAVECFHSFETYGKLPLCREPELLARSLNGKARHGMTVTMCAEDYVNRLLFSSDLNSYPSWVKAEILASAARMAEKYFGFVPTFIRTGKDFTTN